MYIAVCTFFGSMDTRIAPVSNSDINEVLTKVLRKGDYDRFESGELSFKEPNVTNFNDNDTYHIVKVDADGTQPFALIYLTTKPITCSGCNSVEEDG